MMQGPLSLWGHIRMPALRGCFEIYTVYVCLYLYIYVYIYNICTIWASIYMFVSTYLSIYCMYTDIFIDVLIYSFRVKLQFNFDPAG